MNRSFVLLVAFFLSISSFLQADGSVTSLIETIAGATDDNVSGTAFSFGTVAGLATDVLGNVFFTIQPLNRVYRLGIDRRVTVYAGNGVRGKPRNGALAADSPLLGPASLAVDSAGNLYIAMEGALVRVDASSHVISTVFTTPYRAHGSSNRISGIGCMVVGPTGDLYICNDATIKSYSFQSGSVTNIAGDGTIGTTRPGVSATATPLKYPQSLAVAADGTVYFSTLEPAVYRVGKNGNLELIPLQLGSEHRQLDDYDNPHALALDTIGHLFVAQANRSRALSIDLNSGVVSIYGGTGKQGFNRDWIDARLANISPTQLSIDSDGSLVLGEQYRIRRINASDRVIETIAGNGLPRSGDSDHSASNGKLWEPANVAAAPDGAVYITSSFSQRVMRLDLNGNLMTVAGGGDPYRFTEPGPPLEVSLNYPEGLWISESGDVYFSDNDNRIIRYLQPEWMANFATTPKNTSSYGFFLYSAGALVADDSYFYMSDPNGQRVWRISRSDAGVEAYAGTDPDVKVQSGENALAQKLVNPSGLALDTSGNLFIADGALDSTDGRILRVDAATRRVTVVLSHVQQPSGLAFKSSGTLCFSESGGNRVRCLDLVSHTIRTIAGTGVAGFSGDGGPAECAKLNRPSGISFDSSGRLYIADTGNQRVRAVRLGELKSPCH